MNKTLVLASCLSLLLSSGVLLAAVSAPVEISGGGPSTAEASVDSALKDSVESQTSMEKHKKHAKSGQISTPASDDKDVADDKEPVTSEEVVAAEAAAAPKERA